MSIPSDVIVAHRPKSYNSYVHKVVICDKSTVLETALTTEWKEAAENTYRISDFDPAIVSRMLDFMYTTRYEPAMEDSDDALFHSILANVKSTDTLKANFGMSLTVASLFIHLGMNSIADFYDVYQLREAANHEIHRILTESWERVVDWYPAFLEATFKRTTDVNLHALLVNISLPHFEGLDGVVFGNGVNLDVPASFFSAFLGDVKKELVATKKQQLKYDALETLLKYKARARCHNGQGFTTTKSPDASLTTFVINRNQYNFQFTLNHDTQTLKRRCDYCTHEEAICVQQDE